MPFLALPENSKPCAGNVILLRQAATGRVRRNVWKFVTQKVILRALPQYTAARTVAVEFLHHLFVGLGCQ